ncbi:acid phosphatase [Phlyctema vagabunda]|uniref:Acid phosphatase n=1 Tax=Phlyctema vagabunda TaxID=108571 RepID=A0ABR4PRH8_9HELO
MSSSQIHVSVLVHPAPGKEASVREIFTTLAQKVQENEPGVLKYQFFEQYDAAEGKNAFVVQEIYKDQAALDAHHTAEHYKAAGQQMGGLVSAPFDVRKVKPFAGFESR